MRNKCLIDKSKVVGANSFDEDVFFNFEFYLTNLHCLRVSVYKKEVDKSSMGINKRDIKNKSRVNIKNKGKLGITVENQVVKDLVVGKPGRKDRKDGDRPDIEKAGRSNIVIVENLVATKDLIVVENLIAKDGNRVDAKDGNKKT